MLIKNDAVVIPGDSTLSWHPTPLYVWEWLESRLRVDDKVRRSVAFLGTEDRGRFIPYGTALLGLVALDHDMGNTVLITAHHVVEQIPGDWVSLRVNRKDGTADVLKAPKLAAITFTDRAIDLTVLPVSLDPTIYDVFVLRLDSNEWNRSIAELGEPCQGDEVCAVGLYTSHYGHIRNIPVARIGHIAALPEEKVMTDRGLVAGYLIEMHSIAGISGSPIFWNHLSTRVQKDSLSILQQSTYVPLGILIGYHVVETREDEIIVPQFQAEEHEERARPDSVDLRRTGLAVVLPIQHIYGIFESDPMRSTLNEIAAKNRKNSGYRPAVAVPPVKVSPPPTDENPTHREDFTRLLGAAAQKREPKD